MSMAIDEMKCSIREEKAFSIAKNLLQLHILTHEQIAKATELPIAKVQELAEGLAVSRTVVVFHQRCFDRIEVDEIGRFSRKLFRL